MDVLKILGVKISNIDYQETLKEISQFLKSTNKHYIITPNPEIVLYASNHPDFQEILNQADLALPDGIGLIFAARLKGKKLKQRVTGVDLIDKLLRKKSDYKFFLLGGLPGVGERVKNKYSEANIVGIDDGGIIDKQGRGDRDQIIREKINLSQANILLVAFGHPKQERWVRKNLEQLKTIKVAITVGGTFDYLSDNIKRAPKLLRKVGLEWFYRLFYEPKRFWRIIQATIIFSFRILLEIFKK